MTDSNQTEGHAKSSRRARRTIKKQRHKPSPVVRIAPDPRAWELALELADGNVKRLKTTSDGSVIVYNNPIR